MTFRICSLLVITTVIIMTSIHGTKQTGLKEKFSQYQIITRQHLRVRVSRSPGTTSSRRKTMTLSVLGRNIVLELESSTTQNIMGPDAKVHALHIDGSRSKVNLDPDDFHIGFIKGHPDSQVHSVKYDDGWIIHTSHPHDPKLSFSVEPLRLHTRNSKGHDHPQHWGRMIAFRHKDIKLHNEPEFSFCRHKRVNEATKVNYKDDNKDNHINNYENNKNSNHKQIYNYSHIKTIPLINQPRIKSLKHQPHSEHHLKRVNDSYTIGSPTTTDNINIRLNHPTNKNVAFKSRVKREFSNGLISKNSSNIQVGFAKGQDNRRNKMEGAIRNGEKRRVGRAEKEEEEEGGGGVAGGEGGVGEGGGVGEKQQEQQQQEKGGGGGKGVGTGGGSGTRRDSKTRDICDILSIVDYTFFKNVGLMSKANAAKFVFYTFSIVNNVFRNTDFSFENHNQTLGIQVRTMEIFTNPQLDDIFPRYLQDGKDAVKMLKNMFGVPYFKQFCLVHLSTARILDDYTLGVGTIASADGLRRGNGMCGGTANWRYNVGLSTMISSTGQLSSLRVYSLIVSHELGHNFGARHDNETLNPECAPSNAEGGKYLMWWETTKGDKENNDKFSSCSKKSMAKVISSRKTCLMSQEMINRNLCGNGHLDFGEDCDPGKPYFTNESQSCCTLNCRFTSGAICSPYNYPCCQNCTVASKGSACASLPAQLCSKQGICDGINHDSCLSTGALPNGHKCGNYGKCRNGQCIHFCHLLGENLTEPQDLEPCRCLGNNDMCKVCCREITPADDGVCTFVNKIYPDGTPCAVGSCYNGVCNRLNPTGFSGRSSDVKMNFSDFVKYSNFVMFCGYVVFLSCGIYLMVITRTRCTSEQPEQS